MRHDGFPWEVDAWMPIPAPPGKGNNVPTNEPLTFEERREMGRKPVWLDDEKTFGILQFWDDNNVDAVFLDPSGCIRVKSVIGKKIYRRPPEGEA